MQSKSLRSVLSSGMTKVIPGSGVTTLRDVAAIAGVNTATVSVVLNNTRSGTRVSEATRQRIVQAATSLKYRPNAAARGMKHRRMNTVGVVTIIDGNELNLYFLELLNGILEESAKQGYNTTIFSVENWEIEEAKLLDFSDGRVDGLILIAPLFRREIAHALWARTPFVTIHGDEEVWQGCNLDVDNEESAFKIVRYLIDLGHRRIAHLAGDEKAPSSRSRIAGYRRALEESGLPVEESLIISGRYSLGYTKELMRQMLQEKRFDPLPTAIFGGSDVIALGCQEALIEQGYRVPEDVSVIGFDDTLMAARATPPLTTMRQPFREIGRHSVNALITQIGYATGGDEDRVAAQNRRFETEMIIRSSVAPVPQSGSAK